MKTIEETKTILEDKFLGAQILIEGTSIVIPTEQWLQIAKFLKESPDYLLDYLSCVTGVDYKTHLEVVYHLYSVEKKEGPITIKVRTDIEKSLVPSVTPIWRSAEYQEREAYDLVGIHFEGHPDLRRILMWESFEHHPLRKSYAPHYQNQTQKQFLQI